MDAGMDRKTRRIGVETFVFRVIVVIILEMVLLWFGHVSIIIHLIVTSITLFTSSVVACVIFLPDGELVNISKPQSKATKTNASRRRKARQTEKKVAPK
jgi:hypothetical protein